MVKHFTPQKKKNCLKLITLSSLLLMASCTTEESLSSSDLEGASSNNLSSSSIELSISSTTADEEQSANPASNAIDNDTESRWSGFGNPVNLDLDLGSVNLIDYVRIAYHKGDERTNSFQAYTSTNNNDWTLVGTKVSSGNTESLETFDLTNSDARYLRLETTGNSDSDWNSILDIEVYGSEGDSSSSSTTTSGYTSVPSQIEAEDFDAATEGRTQVQGSVTNVGWIDNSESLSYNINVPSSGSYDIDFRVASRTRGTNFDIYQGNSRIGILSSDATGGWATWETVTATVNLSSGNQTLEIVASGSGWNIDWLEVKNSEENNPTVTPTTPVTPTGGSVEDIIGDFWKVTMPVDEDGNASPRNCSEYDCRNNDAVDIYGLNEAAANSDYNDYFYEDNGWVVFTAFCGGATTTNSQYPRCELRGLDSTGDDNYFNMDDYQELNVTVKVLSVPEQRPEVNMVQIHGPDDEPLRIEYNAGEQGLHVTYNESNSWNDVMDYEIGDELKVRVVVENGRISFWLENLTNGDTYNNDFNSSDDTGYFKVGCYLQSSISYCDVKSGESFCSNGGESDDYDATGSVAVKDLTMIRDGQTYK